MFYDSLKPLDAATLLLEIIARDNRERLAKIAEYRAGEFAPPYSPNGMSAEGKDLMRRVNQPWIQMPGRAVAQALAVEGFRSGDSDGQDQLTDSPEWQVWQRSNLDARADVVHLAGADYGQAFVVSELRHDSKAYVRLLSARHTAMLLEDVLSDDNAAWALSVLAYPSQNPVTDKPMPGRAVLWDRYTRYELELDPAHKGGVRVVSFSPHGGNGHNPVTRLVGTLDEDGRVIGEIEPIIPWQDGFTQTLFNLLSVQADSAFRVIYGTGLKSEFVTDERGQIVTDDLGRPVKAEVRVAPSTLLAAEDPNAKFGTLPGSAQEGYIQALRLAVEQFAALTQTPPNFLTGALVNVSAEALEAIEKSFRRKVAYYQRAFGEGWERALRIAVILEGGAESEVAEHGEVVWTDFDAYNLVSYADGLGKIAASLDVPPRGLWPLIPGVSAGMLDEWKRLADQRDELAVQAAYRDDFEWPAEDSGEATGSELSVV